MKIIKVCIICGKEFIKNANNQKVCSKECIKVRNSQYGKNKVLTSNCLICNKEYVRSSNGQKYCSKECSFKIIREYKGENKESIKPTFYDSIFKDNLSGLKSTDYYIKKSLISPLRHIHKSSATAEDLCMLRNLKFNVIYFKSKNSVTWSVSRALLI